MSAAGHKYLRERKNAFFKNMFVCFLKTENIFQSFQLVFQQLGSSQLRNKCIFSVWLHNNYLNWLQGNFFP